MKDNLKLILANIIILGVCVFIYIKSDDLRYCILLWMMSTLMVIGMIISNRLTRCLFNCLSIV
jgi:hypothetical protein